MKRASLPRLWVWVQRDGGVRVRFEASFRLPARLFGITPDRAGVRVGDGLLDARFGPWRVRTPLSNIRTVTITGPYRYLKTAGPAHLSLTDRGLTFATNHRRGVCVSFHQPVPGIEPTGTLKHPDLTVTVADCERLVAALRGEHPE